MKAEAPRTHRRRAAVLALLTTLAALGTSACGATAERALDCGKLALAVSRGIDDLERAAVGSALDKDATEVTEKIDEDVQKIKDRSDNVDLGKAADQVAAATKDVHAAIREDREPDLTPLKDAGAELTKVCTTG